MEAEERLAELTQPQTPLTNPDQPPS